MSSPETVVMAIAAEQIETWWERGIRFTNIPTSRLTSTDGLRKSIEAGLVGIALTLFVRAAAVLVNSPRSTVANLTIGIVIVSSQAVFFSALFLGCRALRAQITTTELASIVISAFAGAGPILAALTFEQFALAVSLLSEQRTPNRWYMADATTALLGGLVGTPVDTARAWLIASAEMYVTFHYLFLGVYKHLDVISDRKYGSRLWFVFAPFPVFQLLFWTILQQRLWLFVRAAMDGAK